MPLAGPTKIKHAWKQELKTVDKWSRLKIKISRSQTSSRWNLVTFYPHFTLSPIGTIVTWLFRRFRNLKIICIWCRGLICFKRYTDWKTPIMLHLPNYCYIACICPLNVYNIWLQTLFYFAVFILHNDHSSRNTASNTKNITSNIWVPFWCLLQYITQVPERSINSSSRRSK